MDQPGQAEGAGRIGRGPRLLSDDDPRVAYATCSRFPYGDEDFEAVSFALGGVACDPIAWDAPGAAWNRYDLVVIRATWDYTDRVEEFLAWAHSMSRLFNAADVVEWNHDKRYLAALHASGVPTIPTRWDPAELAPGHYVVKPTISAGARDTIAGEADAAIAHVRALNDAGRRAMVQPYVDGIDQHGETALLYVGDRFSHAVRKGAVLGASRRADGTYAPEQVEPRVPSTAEHELAELALDSIPFDRASLLYARVDLVPGPDGDPVLLELELIEPSLFLAQSADGAALLAGAIVAKL